MAIQNFIFFYTNYLEYASTITGGSFTALLNTSTISYAYDNRSDAGYCTFNTQTGVFQVDMGATVTVDSFLVLDHNMYDGIIKYGNNITSLTVLGDPFGTTSSSPHDYAYYFQTVTARYFELKSFWTTDGLPAQFGEFVITRKMFQLNYNPSSYSPQIIPIGIQNKLYNGRDIFVETGNQFQANLGYDYLIGDFDSMASTDLQNMSELSRQKNSALFYPFAKTGLYLSAAAYMDLYGWRPVDIFKIKVQNNMIYTPALKSRVDIIGATFDLIEAK